MNNPSLSANRTTPRLISRSNERADFDDAAEFGVACGDENGFVDRVRRSDRGDAFAARTLSAKSGGSFDDVSRRFPGADGDDATVADHERRSAAESRQLRQDADGAPDFCAGAISDADRAEANRLGGAERGARRLGSLGAVSMPAMNSPH